MKYIIVFKYETAADIGNIENQNSPLYIQYHNSRVSCQKGPTCHAYPWKIGPFWQDTLELWCTQFSVWEGLGAKQFYFDHQLTGEIIVLPWATDKISNIELTFVASTRGNQTNT